MDSSEYVRLHATPCRWCATVPEWGDLVITVLGCACGIVFGIDRGDGNYPSIQELVDEWNKRLGTEAK